ncbi:MAG: hypothetical protein NTV43_08595 [Methylococcales bacterium]|nr:hypothetical protein [Methylococcales bacterium]
MKIKYLNSAGKIIDSSTAIPSAHQENLRIIRSDPSLHLAIMEPARRIVEDFVTEIQSSGRGYKHSGAEAEKICREANLHQDTFHHGLAGSALNDAFSSHPAGFCVIASKGEDQKWFDYFNEK